MYGRIVAMVTFFLKSFRNTQQKNQDVGAPTQIPVLPVNSQIGANPDLRLLPAHVHTPHPPQ